MRAGIATIALRRYDVFHSVDLAAEVGFEGVEIWGKPPHTPDEIDEDHCRRLRDHATDNHIRIHMFGSYARPMLPDFQQKALDAIRIAKILGARKIRTWAGNKEPAEADDALWAFVAGSLRDFALKAEGEGMILAAETHAGTLAATTAGCLRLLQQVDAPNFKLNFQVVDPKNPDLENVVRVLGDHIVNVHAQNYAPSPLDKDKMEISCISEGVVDYDHLVALLAEKGFKGFIEAEFLKDEHVSEALMLESLRKDAHYLRQLAAKHTPVASEG